MDSSKLNRYIATAVIPVGLILLLYWRDLGLTLLVVGAVNYALYRGDSNWTVI